jgi:hypothetical protein
MTAAPSHGWLYGLLGTSRLSFGALELLFLLLMLSLLSLEAAHYAALQ